MMDEEKEEKRVAVAFDTPAIDLHDVNRRLVSDPECTRLRSNWQ